MTRTTASRPSLPPQARRTVLLLGAGAASACAGQEPPAPPLPPLSWTHLTPLPLDVASVEIAPPSPSSLPSPPGDVGPLLSTTPDGAVRSMARDRLSALGSSGQAVFRVTAASLVRERGPTLRCSLACRLDIAGKGEDAGPAFVEAAAQRSVSGSDAARPQAADLLLRRTMEDLNVEFEFQVRRGIRRWLVGAVPDGGAVPPPVGREDLPRIGEAAPAGGAAPEDRAVPVEPRPTEPPPDPPSMPDLPPLDPGE